MVAEWETSLEDLNVPVIKQSEHSILTSWCCLDGAPPSPSNYSSCFYLISERHTAKSVMDTVNFALQL